MLAVDWWLTARPVTALGLGVPIPLLGQIGFGIAAVLVLVLIITTHNANANTEKLAEYRARLSDAGMLMNTPREFAVFMISAFLIGCG